MDAGEVNLAYKQQTSKTRSAAQMPTVSPLALTVMGKVSMCKHHL
jgi:hypothetical protein